MNTYKVESKGETWKDNDEIAFVVANNPAQAITKLRIMRGESFYRRMYAVSLAKGLRFEIIPEFTSYGIYLEQLRRDGFNK